MPYQDNHGRFTHDAWNFIKSVELSGEEADRLRFMIEAKTETIKLDEIKAMVYSVVREKRYRSAPDKNVNMYLY